MKKNTNISNINRRNNILFINFKGELVMMNKNDALKFLFQKSLEEDLRYSPRVHIPEAKEYYEDIYDFMIMNLHNLSLIQVYTDGCVRCFYKHPHHEEFFNISLTDKELVNHVVTKNLFYRLYCSGTRFNSKLFY